MFHIYWRVYNPWFLIKMFSRWPVLQQHIPATQGRKNSENHINIWIKKTWKIITSVLYIVAGISRIWDVLDTSSFPVSFLMSLVFENKFVIENSCIGLMLYFINFNTRLVFKCFDCIFNWLYQFWDLLA